jgi:predicted amidohydrolase
MAKSGNSWYPVKSCRFAKQSLFISTLIIPALIFSGCGIMENGDDYQFLSAANGWSGNTKFDESGANAWFDIASVSMSVSKEPLVNRATIEAKVRAIKAARPSVQIILFGETTTGWYLGGADTAVNRVYQQGVAETVPGPTSDLVAGLSKELGTYIAFGMAEREGDVLYNSLILTNPAGEIQAKHRKYLTVHSNVVASLDYPYSNGAGPTTTMINGVPFGLMICNDMHSYTVAKAFSQKKVKVVLSALADKSRVLDAGCWNPLPAIYNAWVVQANRYGTEGGEIYPGAISIIDPAGSIRESNNGDGWVAAKIGVYQ